MSSTICMSFSSVLSVASGDGPSVLIPRVNYIHELPEAKELSGEIESRSMCSTVATSGVSSSKGC